MKGRWQRAWVVGLMRLLAYLPLPWLHRLGRGLGWLALHIPSRNRRNARTHWQLCFPELTEHERTEKLRASLSHAGQGLLELGWLWLNPVEQVLGQIRETVGTDRIRQRPAGQGLMVLSPHLGAWELAGLYLATQGPLTTFYRPQPLIDDLIRTARARTGATLAATDPAGIRRLIEALKRGDMVGILPDQEPKSLQGACFAPLFGIPALTMLLVARLARTTGAEVLFLFAERLPAGQGFRLHCLPAPEGIAAEDPLTAASALNQGVEACIRVCPEQYQWTYPRFRRRPEGVPKRYSGPL
ncbi:Kdo2-lipid IVA lauroyltransferase/acyltransferase [Gammaproteobacteria bacterium]